MSLENFRNGTNQLKMFDSFRDYDFIEKLPKFTFPPNMEIRLIPPFGGILFRFIAYQNNNQVSVYFDASSALGSVSVPYWEIYPTKEGDTARFLANDTDEMFEAIQNSLTYTQS